MAFPFAVPHAGVTVMHMRHIALDRPMYNGMAKGKALRLVGMHHS